MLETVTSHSQSINSSSIFSELSSEHQQKLIAQTTSLLIKGGQTLIKEGEESDCLFFLQQGSLIVYSNNKPIAEISVGEPIGEIAFLTGGPRTATVIASRNCKLLKLDQQTYDSIVKDIPELTQSIINTLAQRLKTNNINTPELEPTVNNVIALLPAGNSTIPNAFIDQLINVKNKTNTSWKVIYASDLDNADQLIEWIENNEEQSNQLILVATETEKHSEVAKAMAEHADKSYLVLNTVQQDKLVVSSLEETVYKNALLDNVDLIVLREEFSVKISGTAKLLAKRQIHLHHHVAINHLADVERIQRFISGKAVGLVLCGGGAFGTAHLGMIKALLEQGYNFDIIGGTSAGSAMAALHALGQAPDEALKQLEEMFVNRKALGKYSLPFYSFLDHKHFDNEVKKATENTDIEDLPINYFAVATNLSRNKLQIIRKGPLWQAVRSSCSLPGILPPYITKEGEVLIDGAVMDNTPIKTLRSIKPGTNIVMNFTPLKTWKVNSNYEAMPRGLALLKQMILPKRRQRKYYPTIFAILSRTMVTNSTQKFSEIDQKNDIFLEPKRLPRMGMMNWRKSRQQFELSYTQMCSALNKAKEQTNKDKMKTLREAAHFLKLRIKSD